MLVLIKRVKVMMGDLTRRDSFSMDFVGPTGVVTKSVHHKWNVNVEGVAKGFSIVQSLKCLKQVILQWFCQKLNTHFRTLLAANFSTDDMGRYRSEVNSQQCSECHAL